MSELDKTIEELEAEIAAELEEAAQDAPKKGAAKGDSMEKVDGEVQDTGAAVVTPDEKKGSEAAKAIKPVKDAQTKGAKDAGGDTEPTKIQEPLAAGDHVDHDGEELEEAKMTKMEMLKAMYSEMEKMKATDLKASYDKMMNKESEHEEEAEKVDESTLDERLASVDVSEDVSALTEGEELSEEFKDKAATIFEAAVKSKLRSEVERIEEAKVQEIAEEINRVRDELTEKVDAYMNYVVEEWMKENEIALERGIKGEIAEDFITGLKKLFAEHYIDVPDERYNVLEDQAAKIESLEKKLNEQIEKNVELNKDNAVKTRKEIMSEVASDLADTAKEKFVKLAEEIEWSDADSFKTKCATIKESYFGIKEEVKDSLHDVAAEGEASNEDLSKAMAAYTAAISKTKDIKIS
jgi:hypothetical protein